jgi:diaminopropionate ammonia-lyase
LLVIGPAPEWLLNPATGTSNHPDATTRSPLPFHRRLPGYSPSPLHDQPELANTLGVGKVWLKDESSRFGLPSFKILGASWATYRALEERAGTSLDEWASLQDLANALTALHPLTLVTATDGNHGRAVAHVANLLGLSARIYVPAGTAASRVTAIEDEGAMVIVVDGTYGDAVARSAAEADDRCLIISDTSWPGYDRVPRWVIDGYGTIFAEIDDQLARSGAPAPDIVVIPCGVGALATAAVRHYAWRRTDRPRLIGVEPVTAACLLASRRAGHPVAVPGPHRSIMAGLNCDEPSPIAWPDVSTGIDGFLAIDDVWTRHAMRLLASSGIKAGETGAAALAGLLAVAQHDGDPPRQALGLTADAQVVLLMTEGVTDPVNFARIVGEDAGV